MKKKGFTLIELMAVIIILGIISLIAVPTITRSIKNAKERTYSLQINRIIESSKDYATQNTSELPDIDDDTAFVTLEELKRQGYVKSDDVVDPRDNSDMNGCVIITYDKSTNQYDYTYTETDCDTSKQEKYAPSFDVSGIKDTKKLTDTVEVNTTYEFPTVTAKAYNGLELEVEGPTIKKKGTDTALKTLDTSTIDTQYELIYTTYDTKKNVEASMTITVTVIDTTPPVITVNGKTSDFTITHECGTTFTVPAASVSDNSKLTPDLKVTSTVNAKVVGTYKVTYTATDSKKNVKVLIITVKVVDTTKPVITGVSGNPSSWTKNNVTLTISATDSGSGVNSYSCNNGSSWQTSNQCTVTTNGTYNYKVKDNVGNISDVKSTTVTKIDKTAPVITVSGHTSDYSTSITQGQTWTNPSYTTSDNSNDTVTVNISGSVANKTPGTYTVTYVATDKAGNSKTLKVTVKVLPAVVTITYKESEQTVTILASGTYKLEGWGAKASNGANGGYIAGTVYLTEGTVLKIKTGGTNGYNGGGSGVANGGGGTTIYNGSTLLLQAGGGGGGGSSTGGSSNGSGGAKPSNCGSAGGSGSNGGGGGSSASCNYTASESYTYDCSYNESYDCSYDETYVGDWNNTGTCDQNREYISCSSWWCDRPDYNYTCSSGTRYMTRRVSKTCTRWVSRTCTGTKNVTRTANGSAGNGGASKVGSGVTKTSQTNGSNGGNGSAKVTFVS